MATATWIKGMLEQRGVPFTEAHHHLAYTAQEVAQSERVSGHHLAKVVVMMVDGQPVELILPASRRVSFERLHDMLGARQVRLATEAELGKIFDDVETGAIPALRHWKGVEVVMDESMKVDGDIIIQGGTHQDTVALKFTDWFNMVRPRVAAFSELEAQPGRRSFVDRQDDGSGEC